jgi:chromate transporter
MPRDDSQAEAAPARPRHDAVPLPSLAHAMLKVGATGFGMGMVGVLQQEAVTRRAWLTQQEFADGLALANLLPGPIAVDAAVYVGYKLRGWAGATVCLLALLVPAFAIMLGLTMGYLKYGQVPQLHGVFRGLNAAVVALVLSVAFRIGKSALKSSSQVTLAGVALGAALLHASPATVVLACGAIGALLLVPKPQVAS